MQSYLIISPDKSSREQEARVFAQKYSTLYDTHFYDASGNGGIDLVREVQGKLNLLPLNSPHTTLIINEAQHLSLPAQNALLKTLEEPPLKALIILTVPNPELLLSTVVSRCLLIKGQKTEITAQVPYEEIINKLEELDLSEKLILSEKIELEPWILTLRRKLRESLFEGSEKKTILLYLKAMQRALESLKLSQINVNKKLLRANLFLD